MKRNARRAKLLSASKECPKKNSKTLLPLSEGFLCDRTVQFMESGDTREIVAVELAEQSMYFERLVRYHKGKGIIRLPEFLRQSFDAVVQFIRNGDTLITEENAYSMFVAADYLLLQDLKQKCFNVMHQMSTKASFCVPLWITCRSLHWPELGSMAYDCILENFENVWKTEEFTDLDFEDVESITGNDRLICKNEMHIVECVSSWIAANPESRISHSFALLMNVRLGLLKGEELASICKKSIVQLTPQFHKIVENWPQCSVETCSFLESHIISRMITPRIPHEAIFVFGGWCDGQGPRAATQVYEPRADHWTIWSRDASNTSLIGEIPKRVYAGCIIVDHKVYLIGGFDGHNALKSILCYDFEINTGWFEISCMYEKRYYVSVAHCSGKIYAMGGHNGELHAGRLDSAERFDLAENLWEPIARMNRVRSDASAASLHGRVYVCGGFEGKCHHNSAEVFNAVENQWTLITRMHSARGGVSLVNHGDYIYAIGGNDGHSRLRSIERYSPELGRWETVGNMKQRRSNLSSTVIDDDIYIIGGWTDEHDPGILSTVEKFNTKNRTCVPVSSLLFPASATCSCTLSSRHSIITRYVDREVKKPYQFDYGAIDSCGGK